MSTKSNTGNEDISANINTTDICERNIWSAIRMDTDQSEVNISRHGRCSIHINDSNGNGNSCYSNSRMSKDVSIRAGNSKDHIVLWSSSVEYNWRVYTCRRCVLIDTTYMRGGST
jgi:hypothetical protein